MASRALVRRLPPGAVPTYMERTWASRGTTEEERVSDRFIASMTDTEGWDQSGGDCDWTPQVQLFVAATQLMRGIILSADTVFATLRQKARERKERGYFTLFDGSGELCLPVADGLLRTGVDEALREFSERNAFWKEDDWVLQTNGIRDSWDDQAVLDPVMFSAARFRTRTLDEGNTVDGLRPWESMGQGSVDNTENVFQDADTCYGDVTKDTDSEGNRMHPRFQRLPSQVKIQHGRSRITSYVNGLHPQENTMYNTFEEVIDRILPMWQRCIDSMFTRRAAVPDPDNDNIFTYRPDDSLPRPDNLNLMDPGADLQVVIQVDVTDKDRVVLGNGPGELPNQPSSFPSAWWRSPGAAHEHICAVAIYCYDLDPDADVCVHLRQPIDYEYLSTLPARHARDTQHEAELRRSVLYNLDISPWEDSLVGFGSLTDDGHQEHERQRQQRQEDQDTTAPGASFVGSIRLRQGRLVVIPACLVYRIHFEGQTVHSGIAVLSLVDPNRPILSTARVPPQSRDWLLPQIRKTGWLARLPEELWQQICSYLRSAWWDTDDGQEPVAGMELRRRRNEGRDERDLELVPLLLDQDEAMYQLKEGTGPEDG